MQGEFVCSSVDDGHLLVRADFPHELSAAEQERAAAELVACGGAAEQPVVIVDLSGVGAAYSRFLTALLALRRDRRCLGGRVLLAAVPPTVLQALERCALTALFELFPTVEAAREAATSRPA